MPGNSLHLTSSAIAICVASSVLTFLDVIAVILRIFARRMKSQPLALDDYLIIVALFITISSCSVYIFGVTKGGLGIHTQDLSQNSLLIFFKTIFALQFTYLGSVTLIKLSILQFYKRIFATRKFVRAVNTLGCLVMLWFITFFFATLFQTIPISDNWNPKGNMGTGNSVNVYALYVTTSVLNIVLDISTLTIPWFVIWRLHMQRAKKWLVSGIFLLGGFVCIASVVRLYYLVIHLSPTAEDEGDLTYNLGNIILWSAVEPFVGLICACLPTLAPAFQHRGIRSILGSVRSFFTLGSTQTRSNESLGWRKTTSPSKHPKTPFQNELIADPGTFYPLDDEQRLVTQVKGSKREHPHNGSFPLQGIVVESNVDRTVTRGVPRT